MNPEMRELREMAGSVLEQLLPIGEAGVRDGSARRDAWSRLAPLGWQGIEVPDRYAGGGSDFASLGPILVGLGAHLDPTPMSASAVFGAYAVGAAAGLRDEWLPRIALGQAVATAALGHGGDATASDGAEGGLVVSGRWSAVPSAAVADLVVVETRWSGGCALVGLPRGISGLSVEPLGLHDRTRGFAAVVADGVRADASSVIATGEAAISLLAGLRNREAVALACDSLGLAEAMLALLTTYAGQRVQFGVPIGSFQAVQHRCADMYLEIETSRALVEAAILAVAARAADAGELASMAKAHVCDTAAEVVGSAMASFGGIGFTWEHPAHLYLKRAKLNQSLGGDGGRHRRAITRDLASVGRAR